MSRSRTKTPVVGHKKSDKYFKSKTHRKFRKSTRSLIATGRFCELPDRYEQVSDVFVSNKEWREYWPHNNARYRNWLCDNDRCDYCDNPWKLNAK